jgi:hypothetical protein
LIPVAARLLKNPIYRITVVDEIDLHLSLQRTNVLYMGKLTDRQILEEIGKIISTDGELLTDGECLDLVIELLEKNEIDWRKENESK